MSLEKFKNTSYGMVSVLTLTAVIVAAALAGFYKFAEPKIEANRLAEEKRAIFAVHPNASDYDVIEKEVTVGKKTKNLKIFKGKDADGELVGHAFIAAGPGFSAVIRIMVGLNIDEKSLTGIKVTEHLETPGLGTKIEESFFKDQFQGLAIEPKIEYLKNKKPEKPNQIQAITGATISSRAIVEAINKDVQVVIEVLGSET